MPEKLQEGRDFTLDPDGKFVLTAAYLCKRGYCCGNGCRNCPYPREEFEAARARKPSARLWGALG